MRLRFKKKNTGHEKNVPDMAITATTIVLLLRLDMLFRGWSQEAIRFDAVLGTYS
jgi:hypothetical protein